MAQPLRIMAPFNALSMSLDSVVDNMFATRLLGDGVALEPLEGVLRAPCDAHVVAVAPTGHSVTLRVAGGAEILIHVGIDTVALGGRGFLPRVQAGTDVRLGDILLLFDLDLVAREATSAQTPIIVLSEGHTLRSIAAFGLVQAGDALFELTPHATAAAPQDQEAQSSVSRIVTVSLPHGIHARPAARIASALRPFAASVTLHLAAGTANARSITSILALGIACGDELFIEAQGQDAAAAADCLADLILTVLGEAEAGHAHKALVPMAPSIVLAGEIGGVRASPGGAIGVACHMRAGDRQIAETGGSVAQEDCALTEGISRVGAALTALAGQSDIAAAHFGILDDPDLVANARAFIAQGFSAAYGWRRATRGQIEGIRATGNPLLIERVADLVDLERQVIDAVLGEGEVCQAEIPLGSILIAQELLPSEFMRLDVSRVAAIVSAGGGPTSHVAILAASRGIPMLVSAGAEVLTLQDGTPLVLDADRAVLLVDPDAEVQATHRIRLDARQQAEDAALQAAQSPCHTADGVRIEVFANCGSVEEAELARSLGAEGCGLLRSEFLFLARGAPPGEDEQAQVYGDVARALGDRPVILRTLDAGSDKPLAYLPMPPEDNPALGLRGVRVSLARPDLLREQLRAVLKGVPVQQRRIMLPMVNDLDEYRRVRAILREEEAALGLVQPTALGIMVETPAAAMMADRLSREVDFLSVGTNDLVQYTLAADRGHEALAAVQDAMHPAVLRLVAQAAKGAHQHGRWIGVCGSLASEPDAAALLIGLGVDELSATPRQVPAVKARIATVTLQDCRKLAAAALEQDDAASVRRLISTHAGGN